MTATGTGSFVVWEWRSSLRRRAQPQNTLRTLFGVRLLVPMVTVSYEPQLPFALLFRHHQKLAVPPDFVFNPKLDESMVAARVKQRFAELVERPVSRLRLAEMMVSPLPANLCNCLASELLAHWMLDVPLVLQPSSEYRLVGWIVPVCKERAGSLSR